MRRSHGRRAAGAATLILSLAAAGCLTASQESRVQTDLDEVRKQVFEMQRDTAAMTAKLSSIEEKISKQDSGTPTRWADLQALLQTLADEVRTLGARLDDNTSRMGSLGRDIAATRDQYRALDARIAAALGEKPPAASAAAAAPPPALDPQRPSAAGSVPAAGAQGASTPSTGAQGSAPAGSLPSPPSGAPTPAGSPSGAPSAPATSTTAPDARSGSPGTSGGAVAQASLTADESAQEEVFRSAYSDFTRGNYDVALLGFQDFLKKYPGSALAAGAQYYTGECFFSQQKYQEASDAFGRAVADHPNMDNAPAAYLKRGLSLLALKQTAQGVVQLQHVIDSFPRSEEARIAADRLRQLGLRDH